MKKVNPIAIVGSILLAAVILIPALLVLPFSDKLDVGKRVDPQVSEKKDWNKLLAEASPIEVSVYRSEKDTVETIPLEQYVVGVVSAEMPIDFAEEALKAQSLTARTYIIKQLMTDRQVGILKGADVSDTETHQVYKSEEELRQQWGTNYAKNIEKVQKAVYETRGQILVYENAPITASYFSTSNGYTENAENYWTNPVPYLVSVESPWDSQSPRFTNQTTMAVKEFEQKLGVKLSGSSIGEIVSRTESNRVETVKIGGKKFSGREIREKLGLESTDFTWERIGNQIVITTKGYGHGIGMSQYGANGMAQEGKSFDQIVKHYYPGVEITDGKKYVESYLAKK